MVADGVAPPIEECIQHKMKEPLTDSERSLREIFGEEILGPLN